MGDSEDQKKKDFMQGFKDNTSSADLKDVGSAASKVIGAGADAVGGAATSAVDYVSGMFDTKKKNNSGGFLGDTDRYKK